MYMHVYLCVTKYVHVCTASTGVRKGCDLPGATHSCGCWELNLDLQQGPRPTFNHGIISSASLDILLK